MRAPKIQRPIPGVLAEHLILVALVQGPMTAAGLADYVWPGHTMKRQGAGFATVRILDSMRRRGLVRRTDDGRKWEAVQSFPGEE